MIIFMLKQLRLAGCDFPASAMQCHPCDETRVGGFSPEHGILMCQNRFMNKKHMEDTLAHEMIHAFDHCRFKVDWGNLRHHACSEVRLHCPWVYYATNWVVTLLYKYMVVHYSTVSRLLRSLVSFSLSCLLHSFSLFSRFLPSSSLSAPTLSPFSLSLSSSDS